jgi:hypothetical protein
MRATSIRAGVIWACCGAWWPTVAAATDSIPQCAGERPHTDPIARVACSLPLADPRWRILAVQRDIRKGGGQSASIEWRCAGRHQAASVIEHVSPDEARAAFAVDEADPLAADLSVDAVGEQAWLWPPKTPRGGAWNLRFRHDSVEVWMGAEQRDELLALARAIAAAIRMERDEVPLPPLRCSR